ncbi:glycosyltransferase, partial [Campylobacter jejuni]|nr:glycosyltransferase [Campylobacter jejuni]
YRNLNWLYKELYFLNKKNYIFYFPNAAKFS